MTLFLLVVGCLGLALIAAALLDERTARRRGQPDVVITDLERLRGRR